MKKIIPALAMLLISAIVMSTASFAWFSMSTTANVNGMSVKAIAGGALLIGTSHQNFEGATTVDMKDSASEEMLDAINYAGEKYMHVPTADKGKVDPNTGALSKTEDGATAAVLAELSNREVDGTIYYKDYVVYLASGTSYATTFTANVTFTSDDTANNNVKATAVDIWYGTAGATDRSDLPTDLKSAGYTRATSTAQGVLGTGANAIAAASAFDTAQTVTIGDVTIPQMEKSDTGVWSGQTLPVVIRVYFDGAATTGDGVFYVRSSEVSLSDVGVSISFNAPETTPAGT